LCGTGCYLLEGGNGSAAIIQAFASLAKHNPLRLSEFASSSLPFKDDTQSAYRT
jgi:hypothetical protein